MRYTVYKTTNLINGRFYVGVHKTEAPDDRYLGSKSLLKLTIQKYGRDAFRKEVLHDFDNPKDMEAKEAEIVTKAFVDQDETYNLVPGGYQGDASYRARMGMTRAARRAGGLKGGAGWAKRLRDDPETAAAHAARLSETFKKWNRSGKLPPPPDWTGRVHTEEARDKMRGARPGFSGQANSQHGTAWVVREGGPPQKVPVEELGRWLDEGWERGRGALARRNLNSPTKGRVWVHAPHTGERKMVSREAALEHQQQGWALGMRPPQK